MENGFFIQRRQHHQGRREGERQAVRVELRGLYIESPEGEGGELSDTYFLYFLRSVFGGKEMGREEGGGIRGRGRRKDEGE